MQRFLLFAFLLFAFPFLTNAQAGPITLSKQHGYIKLKHYAMGYNAQLMRATVMGNNEFLQSVLNLNPHNLRYPGGTNSNYWDWQTGWIKSGTERKEWKNLPITKYTLDDFAKMIIPAEGTPVFVLNMLTSTLGEQIDMLRYALKINLPVKLIELGNEFYLDQDDYRKIFPTAHEYAAMCNTWIDSLKNEFRDVRIAVIGNSLRDMQMQGKGIDLRAREWNKIVYTEVNNADAITYHLYTGSGLEAIKTSREKTRHNEKADYTSDEQAVWQEAFEKKEGLERFLAMPFVRVEMFKRNDLSAIPSGKNAWITEYNLFENEGIVCGTWAHGLYAITEALLLLRIPQTELICYHNLAQTSQFGAIFYNDNAFDQNYIHMLNKTYSHSATGVTLKLLAKLLSCNKLASIEIKNSPQIVFNGKRKFPAVIGYDAECGQLLLNLSDKEISINDGGKPVFKMSQIKCYSANPRKQIGSESDISTTVTKSNRITKLPPYSISILTQ